MGKENILAMCCMNFAIRICKLYKYLTEQKKEFVISNQILRSGTSIGANRAEADYAESVDDFVHKLAISRKEANETLFWIDVLLHMEVITDNEHDSLKLDCEEILKLLTSIILSAKNNKQKK